MPKACPGLDPGAEGGFLAWWLYLVVASQPPLCHSVTSPPARGGEGNRRLCISLLRGEKERYASVPAKMESVLNTQLSARFVELSAFAGLRSW